MLYQFGQQWTPLWQDAPPLSRATQPPHPSRGTLTPFNKPAPQAVMDHVTNALAPMIGQHLADRTANLVDWSPIGAAAQGYQGGADLRHGEYKKGLLGAAGALLSWMPGGQADSAAIRNFLWGVL